MQVLDMDVTVNSNVDVFTEEMEYAVLLWLTAIGEDASHTAAKKAPVDTGRLKNSISYAVNPADHKAYIGTNVPYAPYQEFGTSRGIVGKHFIQFGATAHVNQYRKWLESQLKGF